MFKLLIKLTYSSNLKSSSQFFFYYVFQSLFDKIISLDPIPSCTLDVKVTSLDKDGIPIDKTYTPLENASDLDSNVDENMNHSIKDDSTSSMGSFKVLNIFKQSQTHDSFMIFVVINKEHKHCL